MGKAVNHKHSIGGGLGPVAMKRDIYFIPDTSALMDDPSFILRPKDAEIIIHTVILRQLDGLKMSTDDEKARRARAASKKLDSLSYDGNLKEGMELPTGSILRMTDDHELINDLMSRADNEIVGAGLRLKKSGAGRVILVSTDINQRLAARARGLEGRLPHLYPGEAASGAAMALARDMALAGKKTGLLGYAGWAMLAIGVTSVILGLST